MNISDKLDIYKSKFSANPNVVAKSWYPKEGGTAFAPVCKNEWVQGLCQHFQGKSCAGCPNKNYIPLTDQMLMDHIQGNIKDKKGNRIEYGFYPLLPDGYHCNFGAIDFDDRGFDSVKAVKEKATECGLKTHIARSKSKGWHLYFFFDESVQATYFRRVALFILESAGLGPQKDGKKMPEIFPKQDFTGKSKQYGNLIRTPLIEPQIRIYRNCFVDDDDNPIGISEEPEDMIEEQWCHLDEAETNDELSLQKVIHDKKIDLGRDAPITDAYQLPTHQGKWEPCNRGDFKKVVDKCDSLRAAWQDPMSEKIHHNHRMALIYVAVNTANGIEMVRNRFPAGPNDWAKGEERDRLGKKGHPELEKSLKVSIEHNYKPATCRYMWDNGFCDRRHNPCHERKPPVEEVEGHDVVNPRNLPENMWPEPSPIRYAFQKDEVVKLTTQELEKMAKTIKDKDITKALEIVDTIFPHIMEEKSSTQGAIISIMAKSHKDLTVKNLTTDLKRKIKEKKAESLQEKVKFEMGNGYVYIDQGCYWRIEERGEKSATFKISNFIIKINEAETYVSEEEEDEDAVGDNSMFVGELILSETRETIPVRISNKDISTPARFRELIDGQSCGKAICVGQYFDYIIAAIKGLNKIERVVVSRNFGWKNDLYRTPSMVIDNNTISPNEKHRVKIDAGSKAARKLDFTTISKDYLTPIVKHFVKHALNLHAKEVMYPLAATMFLAPVARKVNPENDKYCLWLYGNLSSGKTFAARTMWSLFVKGVKKGDEVNWQDSSHKGMIRYARDFRDAVMLCDDYRAKNKKIVQDAATFLQNAYNESSGAVLQRSGGQLRAPSFNKAFVISTGEGYPEEGAVVSRTLLIHVSGDTSLRNKVAYVETMKMRKKYNCIMPHFLSWFLRTNYEDHYSKIMKFKDYYAEKYNTRTEADRICTNVAWMKYGFLSMIGFFKSMQAISAEESTQLINDFEVVAEKIVTRMFTETKSSMASTFFIETLKDLIAANELVILNYNDNKTENTRFKKIAGAILVEDHHSRKPKDEYVYIMPRLAIGEINRVLKAEELQPVQRQFIQIQLANSGLLQKTNKGRFGVRLDNKYGFNSSRMWCFKKVDLDMDDELRLTPKLKDTEGYDTSKANDLI